MKAIMYGAGNIGRGFIGPLLCNSGFDVTFVDVSAPLIRAINEAGQYSVRIVGNTGFEDTLVTGVSALDGNDTEAVAKAIAGADLVATAVGVPILKKIVPNLATGIRRRLAEADKPLNILICENMLDADRYLAGLIKERFSAEECERFERCIGLVEASIGRMVPVQTDEMRQGDPLRVCVERYAFLPVDGVSFKGELPEIGGLVPYAPFGYYIKRKLFLHNMGHCVCAYLGLCFGYEFISDAMDDPEILNIVKSAMLETMQALSREFGIGMEALLPHVDDLITRFKNRALRDTCARVGHDPARKLSENDRLVGAISGCLRYGIVPYHIAIGAGAALRRYLMETEQLQSMGNATAALVSLGGLDASSEAAKMILETYTMLLNGTSPRFLRKSVEARRDGIAAAII